MKHASQFSRPERVLIVEDEHLVAWDIEEILRDMGFVHIETTATLKGAQQHLRLSAQAPALVILDLKLRDGDGSTLIPTCQELAVPVLVVTGYGSFRYADVDVVYKPFSFDKFVEHVTLLVGQHDLLRR
jgi:two-component system, response regulator YesN